MKKLLSLLATVALLATALLSVMPLTASAEEVTLLEENYSALGSEVAANAMKSTFPKLHSSTQAMIASSNGRFLTGDGSSTGKVVNVVYKIDVPANTQALNLAATGRFMFRNGYNHGWKLENCYAGVWVSTDGVEWGAAVQNWDYTVVEAIDYPNNDSWKNDPDKTYTANLTNAIGDATSVYVKVEWKLYDVRFYAALKNLTITATTGQAGGNTPGGEDDEKETFTGGSLLTHDYSASASEIVAGDLKAKFDKLYASEKAMVASSNGRFLTGDGSSTGKAVNVVYKLDIPGNADQITLTATGRFMFRNGYNADWSVDNCYAGVWVSTDGEDWGSAVQNWDYTVVDIADYPNNSSWSKDAPKTYTANLTEAIGDAESVYVKVEWKLFDIRFYAALNTLSIDATAESSAPEGDDTTGGDVDGDNTGDNAGTPPAEKPEDEGPAEPFTVKDNFAALTEGVTADKMLSTFRNMVDANKARVLSAYGRFLGTTGGAADSYVVYKIGSVDGKKLSSLSFEMVGRISSREGYNPEWTQAPKATIYVAAGDNYADITAADWVAVKTFDGDRLSYEDYPSEQDFKSVPDKTYTADLTEAVKGNRQVFVKIAYTVYDHPGYTGIKSVKFSGVAGTGPVNGGAAGEGNQGSANKPGNGSPVTGEPVNYAVFVVLVLAGGMSIALRKRHA
ncbi:MAG: hypothetical protein IJ518_06295 [Clostridia bacterium]|nr:hypothetical protein [Clostridia bacterium]